MGDEAAASLMFGFEGQKEFVQQFSVWTILCGFLIHFPGSDVCKCLIPGKLTLGEFLNRELLEFVSCLADLCSNVGETEKVVIQIKMGRIHSCFLGESAGNSISRTVSPEIRRDFAPPPLKLTT